MDSKPGFEFGNAIVLLPDMIRQYADHRLNIFILAGQPLIRNFNQLPCHARIMLQSIQHAREILIPGCERLLFITQSGCRETGDLVDQFYYHQGAKSSVTVFPQIHLCVFY